MTKYSCLIVGCGNMGALNDAPGSGNEHKTISFAKALKESGRFDLYFYDTDKIKMENAVKTWGGNIQDDAWWTPYFDVVIITTPDETHKQQLIEALEYYPKLVICEKPFCSSVAEAKEIIELYEEKGIPILLDYTRRFIPEYRDLIGKVGMMTIDFNRGRLHTLTHALDLVTMYGIEECFDRTDVSEFYDDTKRIWSLRLFSKTGDILFAEQRIFDEAVHPRYDHHTKYVIDNALEYLDEGKPLLCTMYDGLKALELLEGLNEM